MQSQRKSNGRKSQSMSKQEADRIAANCAANAKVPTVLPRVESEDKVYNVPVQERNAFLGRPQTPTDSDDHPSSQSSDHNSDEENNGDLVPGMTVDEVNLYHCLLARNAPEFFEKRPASEYILRLCHLGMRLNDPACTHLWIRAEPILHAIFGRQPYRGGEFLKSLLPTTPDNLYVGIISLYKGMTLASEETLQNTLRTLGTTLDDMKVTSKSYADAFAAREDQMGNFIRQVNQASASMSETVKQQDALLVKMSNMLLNTPLPQDKNYTPSNKSVGSSNFKVNNRARPSSSVYSDQFASGSSTSGRKSPGVSGQVTKLKSDGLYTNKDFNLTVNNGRVTVISTDKSFLGDLQNLLNMKAHVVEGILKAGVPHLVSTCNRDANFFKKFAEMGKAEKAPFYNSYFSAFKDKEITWSFIAGYE